jgi:hypothetical protein
VGADPLADRRLGDLPCVADEREPVVLARRRAGLGVQGVTAVAAQVGPLGAGHDEDVQAIGAEHRAHRVHPRATVGAHGSEKRQADMDLVQLSAAGRRQDGLLMVEFGPGDHCPDATRLSLTPYVSDTT